MIGLTDTRTTIVAIASAPSDALRGIVRIAGTEALSVLRCFASTPGTLDSDSKPLLKPYQVAISLDLGDPLGIVSARTYVWPTARAYAGCPSVEIHTYGSLPILEAIVSAAVRCGARPAMPGEFTMRAFLAGRLDLTQAEAVLGVIDANNSAQLDAALTQLAGNVAAPMRQARDQLLNLLADVEAGLDFVEEDINFIDDETLSGGLHHALTLIKTTQAQMRSRRRSESYCGIVLRGLPNAGKSSLLNAIANRQVAIVSEQAGTTRDAVWTELTLEGYRVRITDTAGIETSDDEVMRQSQLVAGEIEKSSMVVLHCVDGTRVDRFVLPGHDNSVVTLHVATKADQMNPLTKYCLANSGWNLTSAKTGEGLDRLAIQIKDTLAAMPDASDVGVPGTAARCLDSVDRSLASLSRAIALLDAGDGQELIAAEIRQTLNAIGEVTGEIYTDDILDRVFSRFCIGK